MSHPDPNGPTDLTPIQIGEVLQNPVTGERATILELPWKNPERRAVAELTALVGARVVGTATQQWPSASPSLRVS